MPNCVYCKQEVSEEDARLTKMLAHPACAEAAVSNEGDPPSRAIAGPGFEQRREPDQVGEVIPVAYPPGTFPEVKIKQALSKMMECGHREVFQLSITPNDPEEGAAVRFCAACVSAYIKTLEHTAIMLGAEEVLSLIELKKKLQALKPGEVIQLPEGFQPMKQRAEVPPLPADEPESLEITAEQVNAINTLCGKVYENARRHGWWDKERNDGELMALMHSEISEALEAQRHGNPPDDKVPQLSGVAAEMADVVIRVMDFCAGRSIDLGKAIALKHAFNITREYKHGGKKF